MKWKKGPMDFVSEKTFLILRDDTEVLKDKESPRAKVKTNTWPPKMKRVQPVFVNMERPRTANLEKPSVLDPDLVDKLDMSLLSKELLCDSISQFQLAKPIRGGGTSAFSSSSKRRQSVAADEQSRQEKRTTTLTNTWTSSGTFSTRHKRRSFEQIPDTKFCQLEVRNFDSPRMEKQARISSQDTNAGKKQNSDAKKLDDNNNRNGNSGSNKITPLSSVKKKGSRATITTDLEVFTGSTAKCAPEPCKACGRSDQPERFHSHPKGAPIKHKETSINAKTEKKISVPKSIQKPVALNFRSDKNRNKPEEISPSGESKTKTISPRADRPTSAPPKRGPKTVTCYICGREFGTASFPIHEPRCMQKWERENNLLPVSQRRPIPQRPSTATKLSEWNEAAWEESQAQLLPCAKCRRTFLPDRLPIHEKSCKATPKNLESARPERSDAHVLTRQFTNTARAGPATVVCQICGRNFGTRSIKIHEPQCRKRWQTENESRPVDQRNNQRTPTGSTSIHDFLPPSSPTGEIPQKRTVTCYICGRDFGSTSIAIHEPQCLKRWQMENDKLPPNQRRPEPQKPEIIYTHDPNTGNTKVDGAAMAEANWKSHLRQLVPCKRCGRTFNPDRVDIHEKSCKGVR